MKKHTIILILTFIVLFTAFNNSKVFFGDGAGYGILAYNIIHEQGYTIDNEQHYHWMWGFPIFVAPFTYCFGLIHGIKIASIIAGISLIIAAYFFFRIFLDKLYSALLTLFLIINPYVYFYIRNPHSEIIYTTLTLLLFILLMKIPEKKSLWTWKYLLIGIILGLIVNIRITGVLLIIPIAIWVLFEKGIKISSLKNLKLLKELKYLKKLKEFKIRFFKIATVLSISVVMLTPWVIRSMIGQNRPTDYITDIETYGITISQIVHNILFYFNPINTILPILFLFMIIGIIILFKQKKRGKNGRRNILENRNIIYIIAATGVSIGFYFFWVTAFGRFIIPAIPYVLVFSGMGLMYTAKKYPILTNIAIVLALLSSIFVAGMYSDGSFNNYVDSQKISIFPKNMELFSEYEYNLNKISDEHLKNISNKKIYIDYPLQATVWNIDNLYGNNNKFISGNAIDDSEYILLRENNSLILDNLYNYEKIAVTDNPALALYKKSDSVIRISVN
jgi:hypothetical protein